MKKKIGFVLLITLAVIAGCKKKDVQPPATIGPRPITASSSKYVSRIIEYRPAPGQFINESIGNATAALQLIGAAGNMITLGGYGGYVIVTFDHSIVNNPGNDLAVYGNPLIGDEAEWSEPGIVEVMQDKNNNGLPDDEWYELYGSEHDKPETIKGYRIIYYNPHGALDVPWKDNQGHTGVVKINTYHNHNYYPLFVANQDSLVFEGTLLKSTFLDGPIAVNLPFTSGYSDNGSIDVEEQSAPRYNSLDITSARDRNGNAVTLDYIDFVRIYTGQNHPGNDQTGEISTEVLGIRDLNMQ
ncbi:MAG: hypothetical protein ABWZ25_08535 [Chitinophagaceae bacterium]